MPFQPDHTCEQPTCRNTVPAGQAFCESHRDVPKQRAAEYEKYGRDPEIKKLYNCARWRTTTGLVRQKNPICQRIHDDGKQCTRPSALTHHLVDPKVDITKFYDWSNLVAVCDECHAGGQQGETQGHRYTSTLGAMDSIYDHGERLYPDWKVPFGNQTPAPTGNTHSAVGESAIDRALAEDW